MRVLALSRYGKLGASSRQRLYQFLPYLESRGVVVEVSPFLDDGYLVKRYAGDAVALRAVAAAYLRRLRALLKAGSYDLVWIEKEALPWLPGGLERVLAGGSVPLLIDYDDAVFHQYDQHRRMPVRKLLGGKIDTLMRRADLVTACNEYIADRARAAGARTVVRLPTVVDPGRYRQAGFDNERFTIGWIGTPGTQFYLDDIWTIVATVCRELDAELHVIGGRERAGGGSFATYPEWSESSEGELLARLDVGIMPLRDGCWEKGKCGYKLIQYMAAGLPVVASAVGANRDIVENGRDGLLVTDNSEWSASLAMLAGDRELRRKMGERGRQKVERSYSLGSVVPRLLELMEKTASRSRR